MLADDTLRSTRCPAHGLLSRPVRARRTAHVQAAELTALDD
jgi:hypothetical protein